MTRRQSRMVVAALALTLLAACSTDKATSVNPGAGSTGSAKSSSAPGATNDPATNGANQIGVDEPDLSKVMFSKQFAIPGEPQHKVTVGILSLERKDKVAILKVVATPDFADKSATQRIGFKDAVHSFPLWWLPTLLDLTNLKQYKVLAGSGGYLNYEDGEAVSGQPIYAWAVFAAPPANVTKLDLNLVSWMPRFTNVPIR
jgi:hypothetical protein